MQESGKPTMKVLEVVFDLGLGGTQRCAVNYAIGPAGHPVTNYITRPFIKCPVPYQAIVEDSLVNEFTQKRRFYNLCITMQDAIIAVDRQNE